MKLQKAIRVQSHTPTNPAQKKHRLFGANFFGWGGRVRTHEMEESESSALPLGDTPICDCFDY